MMVVRNIQVSDGIPSQGYVINKDTGTFYYIVYAIFDFEFVYGHLYDYALRMHGMLALLRAWYMCFNAC